MQIADRSFFSLLPEADKNRLLALGRREAYPRGSQLFSESDTMEDVFFLLRGYAGLSRSSFQGDYRVIFICAAGEILNETALEEPKSCLSALCLSDTEVLRIPIADLQRLAGDNIHISRALFDCLSRKARRLYHKVGNDNGTYPLKNRLAATLWKLTRDYGTNSPQGRVLGFDLSVSFLAAYMGAKRESVSRALSAMKKQGLITHESGTLTVLDMAKMKQQIAKD